MVAPNTIENPGASSAPPTTDIYAATRVVSPIVGQGTDLTIEAALAALPAAGGLILVKQGTYVVPVGGYILPDKPVEIRGCASDASAVATGTTIDATGFVGSIFVKSFKHNYRIADLTVIGTGLVNQTFFDASAVGDSSGWVIVENVHILNVQNCFLAIAASGDLLFVRMTKVNFEPALSAASKLWSNGAAVNQSGKLQCDQCTVIGSAIEDNPEVTLTGCYFDCTQSAPFVNLLGSLFASSCELFGQFKSRNSRGSAIEGCSFSNGIFGAVARYLDFAIGIASVTGCKFIIGGTTESIRVSGATAEVAITGCYFADGGVRSLNLTVPSGSNISNCDFHGGSSEQILINTTSLDITISGCSFTDDGTAARAVDIAAGSFRMSIDGCNFKFFDTEAIRNSGTRVMVVGCTGCKVLETGGNLNRYSNNDGFDPGSIVDASSLIENENTIGPVGVDTLLDEFRRTVEVTAAGGNRIITLPTALSAQWRRYVIKKTDASANTVTIDADGAELIDGALTVVLGIQYASIEIQSDGTGWVIIANNIGGPFGIFAATRIVSLVPGEGTDLTIAAAIAALPASGGDIYIKGGVYPIAAALDFTTKVVRIRGAGTSVNFVDGVVTLVPAAGISLFKNGAQGCSVEDITARGDNTSAQVFYEGSAEVRFTRVNVHDIGGILKGEPEALFRDSYVNVPSGPALANQYLWKGAAAGGSLVFDNVELFITGSGATIMDSPFSGAIKGPSFKVVNSYVGGGGGGGSTNFWNCTLIIWDGFEIDNAQFDVYAGPNHVVNCDFLDFSMKFHGVWNHISNSKFSQGGTGGALFDAQIEFTGGFAGLPIESHVHGCTFYGNSVSNIAIRVRNVNPVAISGCIFENHTVEAITLTAGAAPNPSKAVVTGNWFTETVPVLEGDAANCEGRYDDNQNFGGSTILGTKSFVNNENVRAVAASITLDESHRTVNVDASGAARTITLPTAASSKYRKYWIKKADSSVNTVTVDAAGAELIDGALTYILTVQYQTLEIQSDGTAWLIV